MKNIFATIEYVAEKILEAITGHKNDEQAHPNLSEQINVLKDIGYVKRDLPLNKNINDFKEIGYIDLSDVNLLSGDFPHVSKVSFSWGRLIFDGIHQYLEVQNKTPVNPEVLNKMYVRTYYMVQGVWGSWKEIATTTKTDILFPYNSGYTTQATHIRNGIVVENNHIYVYINVRKLDGSDVAAGSIIGILPPNCRPDKEIWGTIYLRDYTACYVIITPDGKVIIGGTTNSQYFIGCIDYYI